MRREPRDSQRSGQQTGQTGKVRASRDRPYEALGLKDALDWLQVSPVALAPFSTST
jgi:hypothetical protein